LTTNVNITKHKDTITNKQRKTTKDKIKNPINLLITYIP